MITVNDIYSIDNYPYGFTLKTTCKFYIEFNKGKGFRRCTQTINPKTGRENKPKKSTYSLLSLMVKNEDTNKVGFQSYELYHGEDVLKLAQVMNDNYNLFTWEQIEYIYIHYLSYIKTTIYAKIVYCNSNKDILMKLFTPLIDVITRGLKTKTNVFNEITPAIYDLPAIEATEEKGYQPFKVVSYGINK